jgi:hypothetical protein
MADRGASKSDSLRKTPSSAQQLEFVRLRAFVTVGFERVIATLPLSPDHHPAAVADGIWAQSPALALRGLREAASDVVEMLQDLQGPQLAAFDARLAKAGAPTLSDMRSRMAENVFQILIRGQIRSDDEWCLLNGVLSNVNDRLLDEPTRELANRIRGSYEAAQRGGGRANERSE